MKKILFLLLICGSIFSASAQTTTTTTTTTTHKYYYYPTSNVYFDELSGNYWYWDNTSSAWSMTQTLPATITVVETQRYPVTYTGDDPWKNNAADIKKYKSKNGKEKVKTRDTKIKTKDE
ncbi:MAG: hypothetical protein JWO92_2458 [Chitinophagaceae bacterium]|nr:hypothetical protein [Chitinophagaceae bacterium]MDB5223670.1 hypothetical protein [Chitinophagaceae bacterium]